MAIRSSQLNVPIHLQIHEKETLLLEHLQSRRYVRHLGWIFFFYSGSSTHDIFVAEMDALSKKPSRQYRQTVIPTLCPS